MALSPEGQCAPPLVQPGTLPEPEDVFCLSTVPMSPIPVVTVPNPNPNPLPASTDQDQGGGGGADAGLGI